MKVYCPLKGTIVPITEVNDEMFSERMLGDGIAILPQEKEIYSPIDGEVVMVYETKHAIGLKDKNGNELLIHIGIDTVELEGKPFKTEVSVGDLVKKGDLLTRVDWDYIKKAGKDLIVPIIALNKGVTVIKVSGEVSVGEVVFEIK